MLRSLTAADAAAFHELLHNSAEHLSEFGDYTSAVAKSLEHWVDELAASDTMLDFGIYEADALVGRAALNPVAPPRFGCGYLLAEHACGRGLHPGAALTRLARPYETRSD